MPKVPFPPFDDRPINPYSKIGCGANYGVCDPHGVSVDHSMVGYLSSTDAWFRKRDVCSLTPWGIGGSADGALDGKIYHWMDYYAYDDVQPWSSGPWRAPGTGDGAAFVKKYGVDGINGFGEAIELSDGGDINTPVSPKQWKSLIWLKAAIAHKGGVTSDDIREVLAFMHHREFCILTGKDCPFPRVYNYTNQYLDAVTALMAFFEGKTNDYDTLVHTVAGITLDFREVGRMRDGAAIIPEPTIPTGPIFQDFTPNRTFTVGKGGATVRRWASTKSDIIVTYLKPGTKVEVDGYYYGETVNGKNRWLVQNEDPRGRIHEGAFVESI